MIELEVYEKTIQKTHYRNLNIYTPICQQYHSEWKSTRQTESPTSINQKTHAAVSNMESISQW